MSIYILENKVPGTYWITQVQSIFKKYGLPSPLFLLKQKAPTKQAWKNFYYQHVINYSNQEFLTKIFKSNFYVFLKPNDYELGRKQNLLFDSANSSKMMAALRANVKFTINEVPLNTILFKRRISSSPNCDMCTGNSERIQSTEYVIASCSYIVADKNIADLRQEIISLTSELQKVDSDTVSIHFSNEFYFSAFVLNPFGSINKFPLNFKNKSHAKILTLTQLYVLRVYNLFRFFRRDALSKDPLKGKEKDEPPDKHKRKPCRQYNGKKYSQPKISSHFSTLKVVPRDEDCHPRDAPRDLSQRFPLVPIWNGTRTDSKREFCNIITAIESPLVTPLLGILSTDHGGRSKRFVTNLVRDSRFNAVFVPIIIISTSKSVLDSIVITTVEDFDLLMATHLSKCAPTFISCPISPRLDKKKKYDGIVMPVLIIYSTYHKRLYIQELFNLQGYVQIVIRTEDDQVKLEVEDEVDRAGARNLGFTVSAEIVHDWAQRNGTNFATVRIGAQAGIENEEHEANMIAMCETLRLGSGHELINLARVDISRRTANIFSMHDDAHGYISGGQSQDEYWQVIFQGKFGKEKVTSDAVMNWMNLHDVSTNSSSSTRSRISGVNSAYSSASPCSFSSGRRVMELSRDSAVEEILALRLENRRLTYQRDAVIKERSRMTSAYANLKLRHMAVKAGLNESIVVPVDDVLGDEDKMVSDSDRVDTPPQTINTFDEFPLHPNRCPATRNISLSG